MNFNYGSFGLYNSLFGSSSSSSFYSALGDYSSIRTGSYKKLLTSYYAKAKANEKTETTSTTRRKNHAYQNILDSKSYYSGKELTAVRKEADELSKSASQLTKTGTGSLFQAKEVTVTDEKTGKKTTAQEYDMDAIAKAVNSFVSDYNSAIEAGSKSSNQNVVRNTQYMTNMTGIYKNSLSDVGITIGKDNTLSVDENKLKSANIDTLKKVFNGKSSFAAYTASRSESISSSAARAASTASTYGSTGSYNMFNNYYSSYNWYF
ncbi:MAG: hypothetical protein NC293_12395 [Roseburia sp.]|nr:hypothetical protein [Roseburia sp.]